MGKNRRIPQGEDKAFLIFFVHNQIPAELRVWGLLYRGNYAVVTGPEDPGKAKALFLGIKGQLHGFRYRAAEGVQPKGSGLEL